MEKVVDATVARRQLGTLLDEVYYKGESIIIERKGKALAKIVPLEKTEEGSENNFLTPTQKNLLNDLNSLPAIEIHKEPTDILRKLRKRKARSARTRYGK